MPKINERLEIWRQAWAKHRIKTVESSPARLFTAGILNRSSRFPVVQTNQNVDINAYDSDNDVSENPWPVLKSPDLTISE